MCVVINRGVVGDQRKRTSVAGRRTMQRLCRLLQAGPDARADVQRYGVAQQPAAMCVAVAAAQVLPGVLQ